MSLKIAIASEHNLIRYTIHSIIKDHSDFLIISETENVENFLISCTKNRPGIALLYLYFFLKIFINL